MKGKVLVVVSALLMLANLWMVLIYVPTDKESGVVQRIFYFHVPLAWNAFLAFFIVFIASIMYLWKRDKKWDVSASAAAEIGLVFTSLVLITGSIWARPAWGVWWTWDARLTTALILWLIYVAYFLVRAYAPEGERRARFGAVVGIIGFIDVPIVAFAISLARTQHPPPLVFQGGLAPSMLLTLIFSVATFTAFFFSLLLARVALKKSEDELKRLKELSRS